MDKLRVSQNAVLTLCSALLVVSCMAPSNHASKPESKSESGEVARLDDQPIHPVLAFDAEPEKVELGRKLFFEKRLSGDDTIACASCHALDKGGTDQLTHSIGIHGAEGGINAPSVLNSGHNFVQFWNGRAETLEDQVNGPTHNPKEMGSDWKQILSKLNKDESYVAAFQKVYGTGPSEDGVRDSIATFERTLTTPNAPFDRYLKGDQAAIDDEQKRGFELFKNYGCSSCHQGVNVGGNMYQKMGLMGNYFKERGNPTDADDGRYAVTKRDQDRQVFRVPSLRNITLTAPYFHDGSATTLPQAIEVMAKYQLGRPIPPEDLRAIARFLESLTGDQPKNS